MTNQQWKTFEQWFDLAVLSFAGLLILNVYFDTCKDAVLSVLKGVIR